jgi:hypothetical protein
MRPVHSVQSKPVQSPVQSKARTGGLTFVPGCADVSILVLALYVGSTCVGHTCPSCVGYTCAQHGTKVSQSSPVQGP